MGSFQVFRTRFILLGLLIWGNTPSASAFWAYSDVGVGLSWIQDASKPFPETSGTMPYSIGANYSFMFCLLDLPAFDFQIGPTFRLATSQIDETAYGIGLPGVLARLEIWRFFFGAGYSPYFMAQSGPSLSANFTTQDSATSTAIAEFGILWRIIPEFSLVFQGDYLLSLTGSGTGGTFDGTVQMRFYLGAISGKGSGGGKRSRRTVDGWRYPFGIPLFD